MKTSGEALGARRQRVHSPWDVTCTQRSVFTIVRNVFRGRLLPQDERQKIAVATYIRRMRLRLTCCETTG